MTHIYIDTINTIKPYSEFNYWFRVHSPLACNMIDCLVGLSDYMIDVYDKVEERWLEWHEVAAKGDNYVLSVIAEFKIFMSTRPEYNAGFRDITWYRNKYRDLENRDKEIYCALLIGAAMEREQKTGKDLYAYQSALACIAWLESTDFFTAPASTIYHNCTPGGLLEHTLEVINRVFDLKSCISFELVNMSQAILVALVHDWCKIGMYEAYNKNVKNAAGVWIQETAYRRKSKLFTCLGHGVSSMFLAQRFFALSVEECAAIRWHMGEYNVADNEMSELHQANETYPIVQLIQFADRLSITKY